MTPHVHFYQKGEKGVAPQTSKFSFAYRWLRGPLRPVCANEQCPRAQSFSPLQWSKVSQSVVRQAGRQGALAGLLLTDCRCWWWLAAAAVLA